MVNRGALKTTTVSLGSFSWRRKIRDDSILFSKEVIGTTEAGGRFIALRMDVVYPLTDGQQDVHKALVIAGAEPLSGKIAAHAYTDGGFVREYAVENRKAWLEFEDQPPGHEKQWVRARKILQPTEIGFEERLEVDAGGGNFTPYYVIQMRKLSARTVASVLCLFLGIGAFMAGCNTKSKGVVVGFDF